MARAEYDPAIIQQFADNLYKKAQKIITEFTISGMLISAVLGMFLYFSPLKNSIIIWVVAIPLPSFVGYTIGSQLAFSLKLKAQIALCMMQIEENTRYLKLFYTQQSNRL